MRHTKHCKYSKKEIVFEYSIPEPNSGCWIWTNSFHYSGYGRINIDKKQWRSHRLSWTVFNGRIPKGMFVCHKCDNRACINPEHLFLGSPKDNMQDCLKKHRFEKRKNSKLKKEDIIEIRKLCNSGLEKRYIAKKFNVSKALIYQIMRNEIWNNV